MTFSTSTTFRVFVFVGMCLPVVLTKQSVDAERKIIECGIPITTPNRISYKTAYHFGELKQDLLCWTTSAESGGQFVGMDLQTGKISIKPLQHLEAYPIVFCSNGIIYVGSTDGYVWMWNPVTDDWRKAGEKIFERPGATINHVRVLCEGNDGWLYAGSVYGERARLNISTGFVEKLPDLHKGGNWYISAVSALPNGNILFGTGYKAQLVEYDPLQGKDIRQWFPSDYTKDGFCFNIIAGHDIVYATHFPSGHRLTFDVNGKYLGKIPWPDFTMENLWSRWNHSSGYGSAIDFYVERENDAAVIYDGEYVYWYHPIKKNFQRKALPDANQFSDSLLLAMQYEVTSDCRIIKTDFTRNTLCNEISPAMPLGERSIFGLTIGPDSCIYGGAYQSTLLFRFNPENDSLVVLGDHHPGWSGETFSYINRGDDLITASYTNGAVVAYNTKLPWDCRTSHMENPRRLGFFGQFVYRPTSLCLDINGDIVGVGPAGWGTEGGGIATMSFRTGKVTSFQLSDSPHSIVALTNSMMIVCSEKRIRLWHTEKKAVIADKSTSRSISYLCAYVNRKDTMHFVSSGTKILRVKIEKNGNLLYLDSLDTSVKISRLIPNGNYIYYGGFDGIGRLNPRTMQCNLLTRQGLGSQYAFAVSHDAVYFSKMGKLRMIRLSGISE